MFSNVTLTGFYLILTASLDISIKSSWFLIEIFENVLLIYGDDIMGKGSIIVNLNSVRILTYLDASFF